MRNGNWRELNWTDQRIQSLIDLWTLGWSTKWIALLLSLWFGERVSKNAVIGKAHRLNLPARPSPFKRRVP